MSTTITIRSRCHLHKGRWIPEHKRGTVTITVRSRCHEHAGEWTPEPEGLLATLARAEQRPDPCAVGMRPLDSQSVYGRTYRVHWSFGRCAITRWRDVPEERVLGDHAFGRMVATEVQRTCRSCRKTWEEHFGKGAAA